MVLVNAFNDHECDGNKNAVHFHKVGRDVKNIIQHARLLDPKYLFIRYLRMPIVQSAKMTLKCWD